MSMTVGRLISILQTYDQEAEVRLMSQPSWPFEYAVEGVWLDDNNEEDRYEDEDEDEDEFDSGPRPVFIVEGSQLAYGHKRAWGECER